jgi:hypothetical protein
MAPILTAEDVVWRIAAECAYVDERGSVGIRLKAAAGAAALDVYLVSFLGCDNPILQIHNIVVKFVCHLRLPLPVPQVIACALSDGF